MNDQQRAAMIRPRGKSEAPHMIAAYRAMQMALEALEEAHTVIEHKQDVRKREAAITALREALAEQAEQEPVHESLQIAAVALQDIACSSQTNNLLWWQIRAREAQKQIAERLTNSAPAEPVKQEPVAIDGLARACNLAGIDYKDFLRIKAYLPIAAPVRQAEQEPVGYWQGKFSQDGGAVLYEVPQASAFGYHYPNHPVYAAPVCTKDLTDDEIEEIGKSYFDEWSFGFARAVIAADREKNK